MNQLPSLETTPATPENRNDRHLKTTDTNPFRKWIAGATVGAIAATGIGFGVAKATSGNENTAPKSEVTTSAPVSPTETQPTIEPEIEQAALQPIQLTQEQVDAFLSTDESVRNEMFDKTIIASLQTAIDGLIENPNFDLSAITDSPGVVDTIREIATHFSGPLEEPGQKIYVCPTDINSATEAGNLCTKDQASSVLVDQTMNIFIVRILANDPDHLAVENNMRFETSMFPISQDGLLKIADASELENEASPMNSTT